MLAVDGMHLGGAGDEQHLRGQRMDTLEAPGPRKLDDLTLLMAALNPEVARSLLMSIVQQKRQPMLQPRKQDLLSRLTLPKL